MPSIADPVEVEAKFGVEDRGAILTLLERGASDQLAGFEPAGPIEIRTMVDRYLDTDRDRSALATAGVRARLRTEGRRTTLTLKGEARLEGNLTERVELEGRASLRLDPSSWPPSIARDRLLGLLATPADRAGGAGASDGRLRVVATLRQRRHVRCFRRSGTIVEISLDDLDAGASRPGVRLRGMPGLRHRTELEIELKAGDRADLEDLARALMARPDLGPALGSKRDVALGAGRRQGTGRAVTRAAGSRRVTVPSCPRGRAG